ncbi:plant-specific TFIIB-related protein 1, partial [Tanacetum coccineum]
NLHQKEIGKYIKILGEALQLTRPLNNNSISVHMPRFCTLLQLNKSAQITQHKLAWPFMQPVDIEGLGLRDYYDLMAFGTSSPFSLHVYVWNPRANQEGYTPSTLRIIDETLDAFFQLSRSMSSVLHKQSKIRMRHSLWDGLYVGELSSSAIEPFLQDLEQNLMVIADTVNERGYR